MQTKPTAIGDIRSGGTLGGIPPEAMQGRLVPCHPSMDVWAFAHMILVLVVKAELQSLNMWTSPPGVTADDMRRLETMDAEAQQGYLTVMTMRNMTQPHFRSAILNPENVSPQFYHMRLQIFELIGPALAVDPSQRPTMAELVEGMVGLYGRQLEAERVSSLSAVGAAAETADEAPEGTESVRRLPPDPFVVNSGGEALRVPSAIDSVAATVATADAAIITANATATVDRGAGTVHDPLLQEGSFATTAGSSRAVGDADESGGGGYSTGGGSYGTEGNGGGCGYVATAVATPTQLHMVKEGGGWGGLVREEAYPSPRPFYEGGWGEGVGGSGDGGRVGGGDVGGDGWGELGGGENRRSRGNVPPRWAPRSRGEVERSGVSPRHRQQGAFQQTGAARRHARQGGAPFVPVAVRTPSRVTGGGGGGGGSSCGGGGGGVGGGDSGLHRGGGYAPVPPYVAAPSRYANNGGYVPGLPSQRPDAAWRPLAYQVTAVGAAGYYPRQAGFGGQAGYVGHAGYGGHVGYGGRAWQASRVGHACRHISAAAVAGLVAAIGRWSAVWFAPLLSSCSGAQDPLPIQRTRVRAASVRSRNAGYGERGDGGGDIRSLQQFSSPGGEEVGGRRGAGGDGESGRGMVGVD
eukprot:jgi/Undpi1/4121/HiC_scaffold_16.g07488.m1